MKKSNVLLLLFLHILFNIHAQNYNKKADIIVFSYDRPLQLYTLLESLEYYIQDINSISIVYRTSEESYKKAFHEVQEAFPYIHLYHQQSIHDFKTLTLDALNDFSSDYIVFAVDDNIAKDFVSLSECIYWLEKTEAYGFYLKLGSHLNYCYTENKSQALPPMTKITDEIYTWKFEEGEKDWHYPNTVDMTLYRKSDIIELFHSLEYTNPNLLEGKWAEHWVHDGAPSEIGLFYENSKILNIPLNKVQTVNIFNRDMNLYTPKELLEKFEQGYKIDIQPLHQIKNKAVHTEYEPTFISRKKLKKQKGVL